ncbi:MAG: hypothetical protein H8D23_26575 [Candidatus Brocadiales bacterium]|nr:hypothetical protein [Candidatus Brocadiales bacterium]
MSQQPSYPHDIEKRYVWWLERGKIAIAYIDSSRATYPADFDGNEFRYSSSSGRIYSPHEASQIRIHYLRKAAALSAVSGSPEIPERFHRALVAQVIQHGYEKNPETLKVAQYWDAQYQRYLREGLKYSARDKVGGFKRMRGFF